MDGCCGTVQGHSPAFTGPVVNVLTPGRQRKPCPQAGLLDPRNLRLEFSVLSGTDLLENTALENLSDGVKIISV